MCDERIRINECILVANRGESACRIIKTCQKIGCTSVTVHTEQDRSSLHTRLADKTVLIKSYLDVDELVKAAVDNEATSIHPGWGFLSENAKFERKCSEEGIRFIGPTADNMHKLSDKIVAREIMEGLRIPICHGTGILKSEEEAVTRATQIGYPIMIKAANGGGGIGIYTCHNERDTRNSFKVAKTQMKSVLGEDTLYLEKYIVNARHIEVQVFGDGHGNVAILGERECSVQRRHQKIIEETPSPGLSDTIREDMLAAARKLTSDLKYRSAGTVEFLFDKDTHKYYFMEFNTRLQVEHGVTEFRYGIDLVQWMIQLAYDRLAIRLQDWEGSPKGHAIQVRVYAEDPVKNFQPAPGMLTAVDIPQSDSGTRVDTGVYPGYEVSPLFDPMILKIIQWAESRSECIDKLSMVLKESTIAGPPNNVAYISQVLETEDFRLGNLDTMMLTHIDFTMHCIEVISPGLMTTVQDWPGRIRQGLWRVGVPPSGAMDHLACRISNTLVGNDQTDAVLEICVTGPVLKFHSNCLVAVTGAPMEVALDGEPKPQWTSFRVHVGSVLSIKPSILSTVGARVYLSIQGGIDVPEYLGSRSTFVSSTFGGYQGRQLKVGDMLPVGGQLGKEVEPRIMSDELIPKYTNTWKIGCLPGPYADPDYFTTEDINMFHSAKWRVHHDSNRLGIRLIGPAPTWARANGGEGGSHPSNVHDYVYGIGSVNFTGNMPIIITHDGPSLGGFVCPVTIIQSELWKVGQLRPGDTVQFVPREIDEANKTRENQDIFIKTLCPPGKESNMTERCGPKETKAVLVKKPPSSTHPGFEIRLIGDTYIMIEYGPMELDLNLRFRIHFLEKQLLESNISGLTETAPGVRSLQIRYHPDLLSLESLIDAVCGADEGLPDIPNSDLRIETRILHLPMCFDHSDVNKATNRYMKTVRKEAPYLPSNIEFVAKNNGLDSVDEVYNKVFSASYMCLGLGDVYLGAPCAVPTNPLHRVVNPKYNPARTYTEEGTVGLGGAFMCIYPMSSPGGYQLVGKSLPIWNTYGIGNAQGLFNKDKPWLLQMFDQVRFHPVTEQQLDQLRWEFKNGKSRIIVEKEDFVIREYNQRLASIAPEAEAYRKRQTEAAAVMNIEEQKSLERLQKAQENSNDSKSMGAEVIATASDEIVLQEGQVGVYAELTGMVGDIRVRLGDNVTKGDTLLLLCAMKMEHSTCSTVSGQVQTVVVKSGDMVTTGQLMIVVKE